jgi:hypothetical protein
MVMSSCWAVPGGERVDAWHQGHDELIRAAVSTRVELADEPFFTPFFELGIHRLADAIREGHERLARTELDASFVVCNLWQQTDHRAADVEPRDLTGAAGDVGGLWPALT